MQIYVKTIVVTTFNIKKILLKGRLIECHTNRIFEIKVLLLPLRECVSRICYQ